MMLYSTKSPVKKYKVAMSFTLGGIHEPCLTQTGGNVRMPPGDVETICNINVMLNGRQRQTQEFPPLYVGDM